MQPVWLISLAIVLIIILILLLSMRKNVQSTRTTDQPGRHTDSQEHEKDIHYQLAMGNKIKAIKLYREQTGVGLKEAKEAVERMALELRAPGIEHPIAEIHADNELRQLILAGYKIQAIKYYRQQTGAGLKEAKEAVERMTPELKASASEPTSPKEGDLVNPEELQRLILAGQKIQAIKYYRVSTGVGLKEAKEAVDWLEAQMQQSK